MNFEPLSLRFEKVLDRTVELSSGTDIEIVGTDSTLALALYLSQSTTTDFWQKPHVIAVANAKVAAELENHLRFFDPEAHISVLSSFDVSPYSGLYPNARLISARVRWVHEAQNPGYRHFFIAPIDALLQRTLPPERLKAFTLSFRKGDDLPSDLARALGRLGYQSTPVVEDEGTYAVRGGIVDIFSPAHDRPVRVELFGDTIESARFFNPETQRSEDGIDSFTVIPPREILYDDDARMRAAAGFRKSIEDREVDESDRDAIFQSLTQGQLFPGLDFLVGDFYEKFSLPLDHFKRRELTLWLLNPIEIAREVDIFQETLRKEFAEAKDLAIRPRVEDLFVPYESLPKDHIAQTISLSKISFQDQPFSEEKPANTLTVAAMELRFPPAPSGGAGLDTMLERVHSWRESGFAVLVAAGTQAQSQRLIAFFEKSLFRANLVKETDYDLAQWVEAQYEDPTLIHIVPRSLSESLRLTDEQLIFLRDEDFFGKKQGRRREHKTSGTLEQRVGALAFSDLKPGDAIVHTLHGIGIYEGLKVMPINGIDAEFITIAYKEGDKLYLPIYRIAQIQKYSGPRGEHMLDKLGGTQWQKTKIKVRSHLRELAADLLQLYAKRSQVHRPPFPPNDDEFAKFEGAFPYDETNDQLKAVDDIVGDMTSDRPMDRLVCGDVGFGKTEVAMRAAFKAIEGKRQVAILAPTTVLSFQHLETFERRFKNWPVTIRALNRFVSAADTKKTLADMREGTVDIVIGTHRLLSKDVTFKNLGLMIVDEEQRFGVTHKEKIKKMKTAVDMLTLSATPIPRTLNMSLVGMRDLSIINTPPVDRLPTRTFVTKYDDDTIRKAVTAEIQRGGQIFFLHNRVQSIHETADRIREIVPDARIRIGHGQMAEHELEQVMVAFYHHQIDVLVCTTIIESGIDNPRANTMFIDNAHQFGLSQLYQLRGRVGRSKERAYCYLLIPPNKRIESDAQERLKIIQENTALGSGIRIAHHDLELRGSGNILSEEQSGHIDAVGYEMYLELLEAAISDVKGEETLEQIEPEINVRIPALIPDSFIPDIRIRLSYYKMLSEISSPDDIDRIEAELSDQFGKIPDQVLNLMGLMLIRHHCRDLGIRDLSSGTKSISLAFTERTPLPPQEVVKLAQREAKKYSITPDMRLIIRMDSINWPNIYDELLELNKLCPPPSPSTVSRSSGFNLPKPPERSPIRR
jgi:transcription-repair coupling factor (superfamily II helicase)